MRNKIPISCFSCYTTNMSCYLLSHLCFGCVNDVSHTNHSQSACHHKRCHSGIVVNGKNTPSISIVAQYKRTDAFRSEPKPKVRMPWQDLPLMDIYHPVGLGLGRKLSNRQGKQNRWLSTSPGGWLLGIPKRRIDSWNGTPLCVLEHKIPYHQIGWCKNTNIVTSNKCRNKMPQPRCIGPSSDWIFPIQRRFKQQRLYTKTNVVSTYRSGSSRESTDNVPFPRYIVYYSKRTWHFLCV